MPWTGCPMQWYTWIWKDRKLYHIVDIPEIIFHVVTRIRKALLRCSQTRSLGAAFLASLWVKARTNFCLSQVSPMLFNWRVDDASFFVVAARYANSF